MEVYNKPVDENIKCFNTILNFKYISDFINFTFLCLLAYRLVNFQVGLTNRHPKIKTPTLDGYEVCATVRVAMNIRETKTIECIGKGRYLIVQLKQKDFFSLCEVEVYHRYSG